MKEKETNEKIAWLSASYGVFAWLFQSKRLCSGNERVINVTGIKTVKIYTADKKQEIEVKENSFTAVPGEYCYEYVGGGSANGAGGYFTVTEDTTELNLSSVTFSNVSPTYFDKEDG